MWERNIDWLPPILALTRDPTAPGYCACNLSVGGTTLQPTEPRWPGLKPFLSTQFSSVNYISYSCFIAFFNTVQVNMNILSYFLCILYTLFYTLLFPLYIVSWALSTENFLIPLSSGLVPHCADAQRSICPARCRRALEPPAVLPRCEWVNNCIQSYSKCVQIQLQDKSSEARLLG